MYRREFLKGSGLGAAATILPSSAIAQNSVTAGEAATTGTRLVAVSPWPASAQGLADETWQLARRIEAMTAGGITIDLNSGIASDAPPVKRIDADVMFLSDSANVPADPAFAYFAGLPGKMGLPREAYEAWLQTGGGQALWDDLAGGYGWKPFLVSHAGGAGLWSRARIDAFAEKRLQVSGLAGDVARGLGAEVVTSERRTVAHSLAVGLVDAIEPETLTEAMALGIAEPGTIVTEGGLVPRGSTTALYIRRAVWDRLPGSVQLAIAAATAEHRAAAAHIERSNAGALRGALGQVRQIKFVPMAPHLMLAVDRISEAVVADLRSRSQTARRISESCERFTTQPVA